MDDASLGAAARSLSTLAARHTGLPLEVKSVLPSVPAEVAAIDGSSAEVLKGGGVTVGLVRVGVVEVSRGKVFRRPGEAQLEVFDPTVENRAIRRLSDSLGVSLETRPAAWSLEVFRELSEYAAARELVESLSPGGLLLIDGSFQDPVVGAKGLEALLGRASARGVFVAAVSKSTRLRHGGVSALSAAWMAGEHTSSESPWEARVPQPQASTFVTFVAKLHGKSRVAFRIDTAIDDAATVIGKIAGLAGDPAYLGYPYPLALAHNVALIPDEFVQDVKHRLRSRAAAEGLDESQWALLFDDYHEVLELGA
ncbi:MAG: DNA double-strand break repair nuclease NurA [Euryarchaeota archaeon]|nr:DNA double-strand break repair nuclease NurA [Euryarchaeota archaeon]